jgi:hypothetical protein
MNPLLYDIMINPLDEYQWALIGLATISCIVLVVVVMIVTTIIDKFKDHD